MPNYLVFHWLEHMAVYLAMVAAYAIVAVGAILYRFGRESNPDHPERWVE